MHILFPQFQSKSVQSIVKTFLKGKGEEVKEKT